MQDVFNPNFWSSKNCRNTAILMTGEKPAVFRNGGIGRDYPFKWAAVLRGATVTKESGRICTFKLTEEFLNWKPLLHPYLVQREFLSVPL